MALADVTPPRSIVIGLDYGTHSSGFAYALLAPGRPEHDEAVSVVPRLCHAWPNQPEGRSSPKTRTALLYHGPHPVAWGWSALKSAGAAAADEADPAPAVRPVRLLQRFKLALSADAAHSAFALPVGHVDVQVTADYLAFMRRHIMAFLRSELGSAAVDPNTIQWCLTVPAMWSDEAKDKMRRAALRAALITRIDSDALLVVLEPEAAALHVTHAGGDVCAGDVCMVVDAGGGTVDVTLHAVAEKAGLVLLTEAAVGTGGLCGSTYVDGRWERHCCALVGAAAYAAWREDSPEEHLQLMSRWEAIKCAFGGEELPAPWDSAVRRSTDASSYRSVGRRSSIGSAGSSRRLREEEVVSVRLPPGLRGRMAQRCVDALRACQGGVDDCVLLSSEDMQVFFDPVVQQVVDLVRQQLRNGRQLQRPCNKMVLVGGFAESPYLQRRLEQEFNNVLDANVMVPLYPAAAVLQGAVQFGCNPQLIGSRISRLSYGVAISQPAADHVGQAGRCWDKEDKCYYVEGVFRRFVERGQVVGVGECVSQIFNPATSTGNHVCFKLFATGSSTAAYTSDPSMMQVGRVVVQLPPGWCRESDKKLRVLRRRGYKIKVAMRFGLTELAVEATNLQTGHRVDARIVFEQERVAA